MINIQNSYRSSLVMFGLFCPLWSYLVHFVHQSSIRSIQSHLVHFGPSHSIQWYINGEGESRGIWRIKWQRLWMSQSCFSLGFLSQNSLWKLFIFCGYKQYLYWSEKGMWRVNFSITEWIGDLVSRLDWVASPSRELTEWPV